ncbi:MAG: hypothetical protein JOZ25_08735, partial [Actinobacteria bacterium]|nr:hypothetical protein [Actinomycetota bacterium]
LFAKLGGLTALRHNPTAVHFGQYGAGYGTLGLCLCLGSALVALQAWMTNRQRVTLLLFLVACACSLAGSIALATRGPALATALAGFALVLRARPPRARTVVVMALALAVVGLGAITLRAVRDYSQYEPLGDALGTVTRTSPLRLVSPDLIEFDYLVTLEHVVPHDLNWLNGDSFADVPRFFVPRKLWPGKPKPLDLQLSQAMFGPQTAAGTPFTLPGEAWWNFRFGGALAFLLVLGIAGGLVWRALLERGGPAGELAAAVVMGYSYLLFTRPLGPMLLTTLTAAGAAVAVYLAATVRLRPSALRSIWDRPSTEAST